MEKSIVCGKQNRRGPQRQAALVDSESWSRTRKPARRASDARRGRSGTGPASNPCLREPICTEHPLLCFTLDASGGRMLRLLSGWIPDPLPTCASRAFPTAPAIGLLLPVGLSPKSARGTVVATGAPWVFPHLPARLLITGTEVYETR